MEIQGTYNQLSNVTQTPYQQPQQTEVAAPEAPATQAPATPPPASGPSGPAATLDISQVSMEMQQERTLFLLQSMFSDQASVQTQSLSERLAEGGLGTVFGLTPDQAAEQVSEDGFWGVERTAERLFDMATRLSGGTEQGMEAMRQAVINGFEGAERAWGGELPQISQDTLDRVMEMFDGRLA
ncbi:MAG: hypothetical protein FWG63_04255 [Defluviitaleaceae bacterium]|nr:hypothetical protein [Defluviitaleaceae bacterium]